MKKLNIIYTLLIASLFACEPMNDVYDELDEGSTGGVTTDITFDMEDEDYELALPYADNGSDSASLSSYYSLSDEQARKYIPFILSEKFPQLAAGSSVLVNYDMYQGSAEDVSTFTRSESLVFAEDEYALASEASAEFGFLNESYPAEDYIPEALTANIQDPIDGQVVAVSYKYADKEYDAIEFSNVHSETFDTEVPENYEIVSVEGSNDWHQRSFSGDGYAYMSGFNNGVNEDWLITPAIDLSEVSGAQLRIYQAVNYLGGLELGKDLQVLISSDYDGTVAEATWENQTLSVWPEGDSWDFVDSKVDLSDFEGDTIHVAFKYTSTADKAPAWEVSTVAVEIGEEVSTSTQNVFYAYSEEDKEWEPYTTNVYYLNSSDYDAMGAPGQYDNFSSSLPADEYITTFLTQNYPYAQEEDEMIVVYKYYSSSAGEVQTRGNLYTFMEGSWQAYTAVVETSLLFAKEGNEWVPDNTIKLSLGAEDYSWIVDAFAESNSGGSENMDTYGNFSCFEWSDAQIFAAITERLEAIYGSIEEGQKFKVTYSIYCGASSEPSLHVIYEGGEWKELEK